MIKPSLTALAACPRPVHARSGGKTHPGTDLRRPGLNGPTAKGVALSPDGKRVTYLKAKAEAANVQDLWAADVKGGEPYRLIDSAALSSGAKELSEAEKARRERTRVSARGIVEYSWDKQGRFILVPLDGDLYLDSVADGKVTRLTETPGDEVDAKVSPKGGFVSYVRDQNLYIKPLNGGRRRRREGPDHRRQGRPVVRHGRVRGPGGAGPLHRLLVEPDETSIAYTRVDESTVDVVPRADIGPGGATVVKQRYPRAGRPNAVVDLFVRTWPRARSPSLDLGPNKDIYVARVDWSADGKTLYVQRLSRDQKTLDLIAYDAATGAGKTILTDTDAHWIEISDDFQPLKDGSSCGRRRSPATSHLYRHAADGKLIAQITKGDWPINGLEGVDEARKVAIFAASIDTPLERRIYEVSYAKPGKPKALTPAGGWWTAKVADTGGAFAATYDDPKTPPQTALYSADGKRVRWIEENKLAEGHPYWPYAATLPVPEYGTLKASDGETLYYEILKPIGIRRQQEVSGHRLGLWRPARPAGQAGPGRAVGAHLSGSRLRHLPPGQPRQRQPLGQVQARAGPPHGHGRGRGPTGRRQVPQRPALCRRRQAGRDGLVVRRLHDPDADDRAGHPVQGRRGRRPADRVGPVRHRLYRALHGQAGREQGRLRLFRRPQPHRRTSSPAACYCCTAWPTTTSSSRTAPA
jgi:dipeptidyl-peptidase-4